MDEGTREMARYWNGLPPEERAAIREEMRQATESKRRDRWAKMRREAGLRAMVAYHRCRRLFFDCRFRCWIRLSSYLARRNREWDTPAIRVLRRIEKYLRSGSR